MDRQKLMHRLSSMRTASPLVVPLLSELFIPVSFKKGQLLIAGHSFPLLYFIETGVVRGYFLHGQEEHTCWLQEEGFLLPFNGFFIEEPSIEQIEFLSDTTGWSLNLAKAESLAQKEPLMYRMLLEIYERKLVDAKYTDYMLRLDRAEDRVEFIQKIRENLIYRVINRYAASFLNIGDKYLFTIKKLYRDKFR